MRSVFRKDFNGAFGFHGEVFLELQMYLSTSALRSIVAAVDHKADVYLDGGITLGTDVLKAIALGAKMVFVGRPVLWGLAYDGQKGVERVLEILRLELDMAMALAGIEQIDKIKGDFVALPKSVL